MKKKKANPRSLPASQADVQKAYALGQKEGVNTVLTAMLYVLQDKHDATAEDLKQFNDEINYALGSIAEGYVSIEDIWRVLAEEYDIRLEIT